MAGNCLNMSKRVGLGFTAAGSRTAVGHPSRQSISSRCPPQSSLNRRDFLGAATLGTAIAATPSSASPIVSAAASAAPAVLVTGPPPTELDAQGVTRLKLLPKGWNSWKWRNHNINWLSAGESGPVVLLIHGFGASVYHWRYIVPELAKHCRVYAIDTLGFGWSEKAIIDYDGYGIWSDQISEFIQDVVQPMTGADEKVVLVGNSLGGYNSLSTAAAHPSLVKGVVLLNAAGRFDDVGQEGDEAAAPAADAAAAAANESILQRISTQVTSALKRAVVSASFIFTKQPARVRQVLGQVYVDKTNIDDALVDSILIPAQDPNASEVFYRVITARGTPVNRLLDRFQGKMPLLLLWGSKDPWCVPARATQIQQHYPKAERIDIESGHCPHDDTPNLVVGPLIDWVTKLEA